MRPLAVPHAAFPNAYDPTTRPASADASPLTKSCYREQLRTDLFSRSRLVGQGDLHAPRSHSANDLVRPSQGGELIWDALQRRGSALLGGLALLPRVVQITGHVCGREYVGMPRDELVGYSASNVLHREAGNLLTGDLSMEDHLEQQITQLLPEMILICKLDGLDRLGCLLH